MRAALLLAAPLLFSHHLLMYGPVWWAPPTLRHWRLAAVALSAIAAATAAAVAARARRGPWLLGALVLWLLAPVGGVAAMREPAYLLWPALAPYLLCAEALALACAIELDAEALSCVLAWLGGVLALSVVVDGEWPGAFTAFRRPGGLLGNRNFAGEYLALALPCLLALGGRVAVVLRLVVGVALLWTRCRAAWIAAAVAALTVLMTAPDWRATLRAFGGVLGGGAIGLVLPSRLHWREPHPFIDTARRMFELDEGSGAMRLRLHRELWTSTRSRPRPPVDRARSGRVAKGGRRGRSHARAHLGAAQRLSPLRSSTARPRRAGGVARNLYGLPAVSAVVGAADRGAGVARAVAGRRAVVGLRFASVSARRRRVAGGAHRDDASPPTTRSMNARVAASPCARAFPSRIQCASSRSTNSSAAPRARQLLARGA